MKIINKTSKTTLSDHAFEATSLLDKSLGLLDPKKPRSLLLRTRFGIHTIGMEKSIDVLILNNKHTVVALKKNLKPFRIFLWHPKYDTVLELPAGTITKTNTEIGDLIHFTP